MEINQIDSLGQKQGCWILDSKEWENHPNPRWVIHYVDGRLHGSIKRWFDYNENKPYNIKYVAYYSIGRLDGEMVEFDFSKWSI
jgi:antitoxin component YwqK of YwqJK toxin-antitoxin module